MIYTMAFVVVLVSITILVPTASAENHSNGFHQAVILDRTTVQSYWILDRMAIL